MQAALCALLLVSGALAAGTPSTQPSPLFLRVLCL
ncbi:hypothetical protein E2C01_068901 [Portunus trituberculatus]|uniref:Uncharacterized protein n=1 Tax=Portunus trituberculatus TaxID=210409 RepID=A0A5B7HNN4_PORTR|nr:hypothetical protein [Portunus trituberculatus]